MDSTTLTGLVRRFVRGYIAVRGHPDAAVAEYPAGVYVEYHGAMGRQDELFYVPAADASALPRGLPAVRPSEWLTVFHVPGTAIDVHVPEGFEHGADEFFMARACGAEEGSAVLAAIRRVGATDRALFDATPGFAPMVLDPAVGQFAAAVDGAFAASARYGFGEPGDIVVDRVVTRPEYRRRGLAGQLMAVILSDAAARGAETALLISSEQGLPLYQHLGFEMLSRVTAYRQRPG